MRPIYFVAAQDVVVDRDTGNQTIINILQEIASLSFPFYFPIAIGLCLEFDKKELSEIQELSLIIINNSIELKRAVFSLNPSATSRVTVKASFGVIEIKEQGRLDITLLKFKEVVASYSIIIKSMPLPK